MPDYLIGLYFASANTIYVNLFAASEVRWTVNGVPVRLAQTTRYPEGGEIELRIEVPTPVLFTVHVRIPGWLESPARLSVNDKPWDAPAERGTFASIRRSWKRNDTIQVALPFSLRTEPVDQQHADTVAVMWGPLMLVALSPTPGVSLPLPQGLRRAPYNPATFELEFRGKRLRFTPFYAVGDQTYTNYLVRA